mgnify:CR=1 FL=1
MKDEIFGENKDEISEQDKKDVVVHKQVLKK